MEVEKRIGKTIKDWAEDERPREKLIRHGANTLSNSELLAILIATGSGKLTAIDLGKQVMELGRNDLNELGKVNLKSLMGISGIGEAKAVTIAAALELGRRRQMVESTIPKVTSSKEIAEYLKIKLKDYTHEVFAVVYLNQANKVKNIEIISHGGITGTVVDPRVVLKKAILEEATALIICHNHPSGNLKPSRADEELTKKLKQAAELVDIRVLDHIIVSDEGYFSFSDDGRM